MQRGVESHAHLYRVRADILKHRVQLLQNQIGADVLHIQHAAGVFRHNGHDDAHAVYAVGAEGFQIGLHARAAAAIRTRNGEYAFHRLFPSFCPSAARPRDARCQHCSS